MNRVLVFLGLLVPLSSCDLGHSPHTRSDGFQIAFRLMDTAGTPTTLFHAGESFDMEFVLENFSGNDQTYHHTGPAVVFDILSADTVVCTSVDGMMFPQVVLGGVLRDGETYRAAWRAPNSAGRLPRISLAPGTYEARAHHGAFFDSFSLSSTNTTHFTVLP